MTFYLMHRGWMDNPVLQTDPPEPFTRREAWAWLIENAAFKPTRVRAGGQIVTIDRGQLTHSLRHIGAAWRWDYQRVRRFLIALARDGMIKAVSETGHEADRKTAQMIISICNYAKYQIGSSDGETGYETADETVSKQSRNNKNEGKELLTSEPKGSSGGDASAREVAIEMARTWRSECGDILAVPNKLDRQRVAALNRRWRDTFHRNLDEWHAYCQAIRASPFCCGENEGGWMATLNWALTPKAITAIQEGNYDRGRRNPKQSPTDNLVQGFGRAAEPRREEVDCGAYREAADPLLDPGYEPAGPGGSGAGLDRRPAGVWGSDRGGSLPRIPPHAEPPADPGGYSETLH